jgi:hypothetical protein
MYVILRLSVSNVAICLSYESFKTSGSLKGMYEYEVSITSNCRLAKSHSVMSQNVLGGLNHSVTIFTLINSPILIDLRFECFKNSKSGHNIFGREGGRVKTKFLTHSRNARNRGMYSC